MLTFDIITIFPDIFKSFLKESLIARAQKKLLININIHNLRKWAYDKHKSVDDRPFGGGLGMVIKVEPVYRAVSTLISNFQFSRLTSPADEVAGGRAISKNKRKKVKVILFTPRGKKFNQKIAYQLSKLDQVIIICGRYEGVDERVAKHIADLELSVGDYDLMGGDLPAMLVMEVVSRLIPGVLGKPQLLEERIIKEKGFIEYPQYTRPEIFEISDGKKWKTPKVLLSGDHKKIAEWRKEHQKIIE